jgi:hypothetical protein
MDKREMARIRKRIRTLQRHLCGLGPVMRGSVVVIGTRNKQPYFSLHKEGKTQLIYLGKRRQERAKAYSANYKKLRDIVEEMTILNMRLLKEDAGL